MVEKVPNSSGKAIPTHSHPIGNERKSWNDLFSPATRQG